MCHIMDISQSPISSDGFSFLRLLQAPIIMPPYEDKPLNMLAIEMTPHIQAIVNKVPWSHLPQDYVYGFIFVMPSMYENIRSVKY